MNFAALFIKKRFKHDIVNTDKVRPLARRERAIVSTSVAPVKRCESEKMKEIITFSEPRPSSPPIFFNLKKKKNL